MDPDAHAWLLQCALDGRGPELPGDGFGVAMPSLVGTSRPAPAIQLPIEATAIAQLVGA